jgi:hypothetical protein
MTAEKAARQRSEGILNKLRSEALTQFKDETGLIVGVNGSYARREATSGSDLDIFYLTVANNQLKDDTRKGFDRWIESEGIKLPSSGGVFDSVLRTDEILGKIGGQDDTNVSITRRLLLLLEGEWLYNEVQFGELRRSLIEKYVPSTIPDNKICLFLLNDIIRYWRTICVDYEFKTGDTNKPRGIRLIKLRFSRILLVFGGIAAVAETYELTPLKKREKLQELLSLDVLNRVSSIFGNDASQALQYYDKFLQALDDSTARTALESSGYEQSSVFSDLRSVGRQFKDELLGLLKTQYDCSHPIHKSLIL